jgi:hypothetical protein
VIALVKDKLANEGIEITATGSLDYKTIDEKMLIDNHYGAAGACHSSVVSSRTTAGVTVAGY